MPSSRSRPSSDDLKYARGVGARVPSNQRPLTVLERIVLCHVGIFLVGTTWAFGGAADFVRPYLAWWGSLGVLLTLTAIQDRQAWDDGSMRPLTWLWPFVAFNALVLVACLNPSFREIKYGAETMLANIGGYAGFPSSARPALAVRQLWLFDAVWISCFNLALVIRQRRALRGLLMVAGANALVLSIFGTVQKLAHAKGLYFDAIASPQIFFFSSFVYHNHWGAFIVLMAAATLGLTWHYARRIEARDAFHSPAFAGVVIVLIFAVTVPLSTSRSCSVLMALLLGAAFLHWTSRLVQRRRRSRESVVGPLAGAAIAVVIAGAGIWYVAQDSITLRVAKTRDQLQEMRARGSVGARAQLYANTWRMAKDHLWFGWGMASYPHVFMEYNTQDSPQDHLPIFYHDAHSDWLQALAEHGIVGTTLLGLCGLVPLLGLRHRHLSSVIPIYLLAGCGLILLYAWVEFPFGNVAVVLSWWISYFSAIQYARLYDREAPTPVKIISLDPRSPLSA